MVVVNLSNIIGTLLVNLSKYENFAKYTPHYFNHLQKAMLFVFRQAAEAQGGFPIIDQLQLAHRYLDMIYRKAQLYIF